MQTLKINFADFWPNFNKTDNYFYFLLSHKYDVEISEDPDLLFFSVDYAHRSERDKYSCKKIFYTGENVRPNFSKIDIDYGRYLIGPCDVALSFDNTTERNFRLPLWAFMINWFGRPYFSERDPAYLVPLELFFNRVHPVKEKFCNFLFSNESGNRMHIYDILSKYKKIDSPGRLLNNMQSIGGRGDQIEKVVFQSNYKFTIAAENAKYNGYVTEKILHPLSVGSIPIYWGSDEIEIDFSHNAFINANHLSDDDLIDLIRTIDNDPVACKEMSSCFPFTKDALQRVAPHNVLKFIEDIL